ncbi:MFS transporter [Streptomyces sp. MS06]|uniref:MFS transporter n=1 Tax=Streptomyces sp. MS06 TaxID=3385974 RepID=UPI0039A0F9FC
MGDVDVPGVPEHGAAGPGHGAAAPSAPPPGRKARGPAPDGRRDTAVLWSVNAVDGLGSQASGLVFPLLLLNLGHPPATAGAFATAAAVAGVLLGPLVAVPADRGHRRSLMTGAAALASLAMAGLAVAAFGHPPLWPLLALAFTERLCATAYEAAARGALARLASPEDMPRAVAGLQAGDQAALVAGPALGGVLFAVGRFLPFAVDAVSYALAALGIRLVRRPLDTPAGAGPAPAAGGAPEPASAGGGRPGRAEPGALRAGLVVVLRSPVLRLVLLWSSVASGALALLFYTALFVLGGDSGSAVTGAVLAASGAAGLAGSLLAARVVRRLGARRSLTAATWLLLPPCAALASAGGPWWWGPGFAALSAVLPVVTVVLGSAAVLAAPQEVQSRAGAVLAAGAALAAAAAPACAAALLAWGGSRTPAVCCLVVLALLAVHTQRAAPAVLRAAATAREHAAAGAAPQRTTTAPPRTATTPPPPTSPSPPPPTSPSPPPPTSPSPPPAPAPAPAPAPQRNPAAPAPAQTAPASAGERVRRGAGAPDPSGGRS